MTDSPTGTVRPNKLIPPSLSLVMVPQQHTVTNTRCTHPVVPTPLKVFLFIPFTRGFKALNGWKQLHLLRTASKWLNQANGAPKDDVRNKPKWKTLGKPFLFAGHFPPQTPPLIVGTFRNHKSSLYDQWRESGLIYILKTHMKDGKRRHSHHYDLKSKQNKTSSPSQVSSGIWPAIWTLALRHRKNIVTLFFIPSHLVKVG